MNAAKDATLTPPPIRGTGQGDGELAQSKPRAEQGELAQSKPRAEQGELDGQSKPSTDDGVKPNAPSSVVFPHEAMLRSTAYQRLRAEHPAEFAPSSVFFTHDAQSAIDRRTSFRVKAALVYEAVTGHHDHDHMPHANTLLLEVAKKCHAMIQQQAPDLLGGAGGSPAGGPANPDADSKGSDAAAPDVTDEHWDGSRKRVVDGIFLVVGFLPKLKAAVAASSDRDGVDSSFRSQLMHGIVTDVVKLENQIPLQDLLFVARHAEAAIKETLGRPEFKDVKAAIKGEYKQAVTEQNLDDVIHGFCWYYSPFATTKNPDSPWSGDGKMATRTLLDCLHMSVTTKPSEEAVGKSSCMPTARELRRSGVRLQATEKGSAKVEFAQPTVRLPALVYDFKLATVARNLLARECEMQSSKPITRYFQMLNEIVEDVADVRLLRRAGVVRGGSRGAQEVHKLIKNIDGYATYPSVFVAMDREIEKVRKYHDQRMAKFFVRNRPGLIWASSVAAISVIAIKIAARRNRGGSSE